jgi:hypothetical protein
MLLFAILVSNLKLVSNSLSKLFEILLLLLLFGCVVEYVKCLVGGGGGGGKDEFNFELFKFVFKK